MNSVVTTSFELTQKILDLQIICCKKDIEIYKLKKQINEMVNITVSGLPLEEPTVEATLPLEEPTVEVVEVKSSLEKTIKVKVKECHSCRTEDRKMFSTKGYKCEDEECMNFK